MPRTKPTRSTKKASKPGRPAKKASKPVKSASKKSHAPLVVPVKAKPKEKAKGNGATLSFEKELFDTANGLRGNVDPAEYKHIVLGLIFLKYISDLFDQHRAHVATIPGADLEDRDEYAGDNVFWVPKEARWASIQANAKSPKLGVLIDDAMVAIESENGELQGVLPKDYANPKLDPARLGKLIDHISSVTFDKTDAKSRDMLGRVYEYFLKEFAGQEGKQAGEFYTPRCIVGLLVEMIQPFKGRVFDPCCGSGGMFVQSEEFVLEHGGRVGDVSIFGQESNHTTWRLAKMNMAIRGIDADIRWNPQGSFVKEAHPDLKADFILANPPFNDKEWGGAGLRTDKRWKYGIPPSGNANYAWIQHFVSHLSATGVAGFVMANGSLASDQSGEGEIRKALIEGNLVDCIVALPGQLFYGTQISVCVWIVSRDRQNHKFRDRRKEILFIDAGAIGSMVDRTHKELLDSDIARIAQTYHSWRQKNGCYEDVPGFCKSAQIDLVEKRSFVLTPGRYVAPATSVGSSESFKVRMRRLTKSLLAEQQKSRELDLLISSNLESLDHEV